MKRSAEIGASPGVDALAAIGTLVGVVWLTWWLTPVMYAEVALATAAADLAGLVILGPIARAARLHAANVEDRPQDLRELLLAVRHVTMRRSLWTIVAGVSVTAIFWVGYRPFAPLFLGTAGFIVFNGGTTVVEHVLEGLQFHRLVNRQRALRPFLRYSSALVLLALAGPGAGIAMLGFAAGSWIMVIVELPFAQRHLSIDGTWTASGVIAWVKRLHESARPHQRTGLFRWALTNADRTSLAAVSGLYSAGTYTVVHQLAYVPLVQLATIIAGREARDGRDGAQETGSRRRVLIVFTILASLIVAAAALFHARIFQLLPETYRPASWLFPFMALAATLYAIWRLIGPMSWRAGAAGPLPPVAEPLLGAGLVVAGVLVGGAAGAVAALVIFPVLLLARSAS